MKDPKLNLQAIFCEALDKESDRELREFLNAACGNDAGLRAEVQELLKSHRAAGNFLAGGGSSESTTNLPPITQKPGARIGPYKLVEQIGEGGFGMVYLAEQQHPVRREVALKIIKPGMDTKQVIARFEAERQALALMDHPNIAKVLDAGETDSGRPYFAMELVKGVPVTEYCDRCNLTIRDRLDLFVSVCRAVQHAHQKGIIHRDLKPTNVLIAISDGQPIAKIIDFGVAKAITQRLTEKTLRTGFAQMLGTPMYMSPEQAEMSPLDVDTRTDIYALGVLLYELLTGTTPFEESRMSQASYDEIRRVIREEDPPRPSARLSTLKDQSTAIAEHRRTDPRRLTLMVRGELDWIVMKALEKDRTRRYETANALARDVERFLNEEAVEACPPSTAYRLRKLYRRNKLLLSAVAVVAATIMVASAISIWLAIWATQAEVTAQNRFKQEQKAHLAADQARKLEAKQRELAEAQRRLAEQRLFDSYLSEARARRRDATAGRRFESLARVEQAAELARKLELQDEAVQALRNEAIAALSLFDLRVEKQWPGFPPRSSHDRVAFDRSIEYYARLEPDDDSSNGYVAVRRMSDNELVVRLPGAGSLQNRRPYIRFSPDGNLLAVRAGPHNVSTTEITIWKIGEHIARQNETGDNVGVISLTRQEDAVLHVTAGGDWWDTVLDFSPDSRRMATVTASGAVCLYDLQGVQKPKQFAPSQSKVRCIRFDPGGQRLAAGGESTVQVLDIETGSLIHALPHNGELYCLAWTRDSRYLVAGGNDKKIIVWDAERAKQVSLCQGHGAAVKGVAFNRAGNLLISWSWDATTRVWNSRTGEQLLTTDESAVQFSDDDRFVGFAQAGETVGRFEVAPAEALRVLNMHDLAIQVHRLGFTPDGRGIVSGTDNDGVRFWDLRQQAEIAHLAMVYHAVFDSIGQRLFTVGRDGFVAWDVQHNEADASLRIKSARQFLATGGSAGWITPGSRLTRDGRTLAVTASHGKFVFIEPESGEIKRTINAPGYLEVSISPDGRWAAAGPVHSFPFVTIWNLESGAVARQLPLDNSLIGHATFSPAGNWVVTNDGSKYSFWTVGTWQRRHTLPGSERIAFTADGNQFAILSDGVVHIYDSTSMQELASLRAPGRHSIKSLCFSPQKTHLAAGTSSGAVHLWDLRYIRERLAEMGLDWDLPTYPPVETQPNRKLTFDFDFGDRWQLWYQRAVALVTDEDWPEAIASYNKALELGLTQEQQEASRAQWAELHNMFSWLLCTCPQSHLRDSARAIQLAKQAVELSPGSSHMWNTLGAAHHRAGNWQEALDALDKSMDLRNGGDAYDWFMLAMAHWQLENKNQARKWYVKAALWMEQNKPDDQELIRFRTEAGQLLQEEPK